MIKSRLTSVYKKTGSLNRVQAARHYLDNYTAPPDADSPPPPFHGMPQPFQEPGAPSLIQRQMREIQVRLDQLASAASEVERLERALDALCAIEP